MRRWCSTVVHSIMCGFEKVTSSIETTNTTGPHGPTESDRLA
jgi:hypothetical protein